MPLMVPRNRPVDFGTTITHSCGLTTPAQLAASPCLGHPGHRGRAGPSQFKKRAVFQMSQDTVESKGSAEHPRFTKPQRVAFVQSAWHRDVVAECRERFLTEIEARHIARASIDVFEVPGAFEIPLHVQLLAKTR